MSVTREKTVDSVKLQTMPLRFRVWDRQEKRFISPGQFAIDGDGYLFWLKEYRNGLYSFSEASNADYHRFIISQGTGFVDKNGKHIFTGNIIGDEYRAVIVGFRNGSVSYKFLKGEGSTIWPADLETVGNIWQNPELLETKNA